MNNRTDNGSGSVSRPDSHDASPLAIVLCAPEAALFFSAEAFEQAQCRVVHAHTVDHAKALCDAYRPDVVVMPLHLGEVSLLPYLSQCKSRADAGIIVIADSDEINRAADAMRIGADDCLFHPFSPARLTRTVSAVVARGRPRRAAQKPSRAEPAAAQIAPQPAEAPTASGAVHGMIGNTPDMRRLFRKIDAAARVCDPVLIHGEVGTGKTRFAHAIHAASDRADGPLITIDCAATERDDLILALHGHGEESAYRRASGGTLIFDRLDELDRGLQGRLLPLIASTEPDPDVRIIATLTRSPTQALAENRLREDLFYSLNVIAFPLPPLRLRTGDVGRLIAAKVAEMSDAIGRAAPHIDSEAMALLGTYAWPGNLSELMGTLKGLLLTCGDTVSPPDLPQEVLWQHMGSDARKRAGRGERVAVGGLGPLVGKKLADVERAVIEATIAAEGGSVPRAAKVLDVSPSTLYRKRESWANRS